MMRRRHALWLVAAATACAGSGRRAYGLALTAPQRR